MKLKQFQDRMKEEGFDISIFVNSSPIHDSNIQYFTAFRQTRFHAFSCLLIKPEESILIVSRLEYDRASKEAKVDSLINMKEYNNSLTQVLNEKLGNGKKIGVNESIFPYKLSRKLEGRKIRNISEITDNLRSVKTGREIRSIRKSCKIANHGIKLIERNLSTKISESELTLILEQELKRRGAEEMSFPTIITSGKRSAYIHPDPSYSEKKIQKGLGLVDFGVRYQDYCSDITVPFSVGKLNKKEMKIIKTVKEAYNQSVDDLKLGKPTWKVYETVEKTVEKFGFEMKHSLGHGLGLDIHESPSLSPKPGNEEDLKNWKEIRLEEGMVFTIEPGVYVPGLGGCRLENDFLMQKKPKVLTKSKFIEL